jgi:hypothetical protein
MAEADFTAAAASTEAVTDKRSVFHWNPKNRTAGSEISPAVFVVRRACRQLAGESGWFLTAYAQQDYETIGKRAAA